MCRPRARPTGHRAVASRTNDTPTSTPVTATVHGVHALFKEEAHVTTDPKSMRVAEADEIQVIRLSHRGRKVAAALSVALLAAFAYAMFTNPNIEWGVIAFYFTEKSILTGALLTVQLTILSMVVGVVLGVVLAVMRLSDNPVLNTLSGLYIWFFRGTPQLIQLIFWFNLAFLFPRLGFGDFSQDTNLLITPFAAALIGLSLNEAAYMAEIVRAGIIAVNVGQKEAAMALGLTPAQILRKVVLPQAMRMIIPPTGNQAIAMLKVTSLCSVISARELLTNAQIIYAKNFLIIELLIVASLWYLVMTTIATFGQYHLEKHFNSRGYRNVQPLGPVASLYEAVRKRVRRSPREGSQSS